MVVIHRLNKLSLNQLKRMALYMALMPRDFSGNLARVSARVKSIKLGLAQLLYRMPSIGDIFKHRRNDGDV